MSVADTILEQLGGRKFIAMTGARHFLSDETMLSFRLPGGRGFCKSGINYIRISISLDSSDTYTLTFAKIKKHAGVPSVMSEDVCRGIYADELRSTFTEMTGLAVSL